MNHAGKVCDIDRVFDTSSCHYLDSIAASFVAVLNGMINLTAVDMIPTECTTHYSTDHEFV